MIAVSGAMTGWPGSRRIHPLRHCECHNRIVIAILFQPILMKMFFNGGVRFTFYTVLKK